VTSHTLKYKYRLLLLVNIGIGIVFSFTKNLSAREIPFPGTYTTIQQTIDASQPGDQINIAAGTYQENLILKPGVSLYGEDAQTTIIKGSPVLNLPVVTVADKSTLARVTVTGGKDGGKGAVYIQSGTSYVQNCFITDNQDAGILIEGKATPVIEHNKIFKNQKSAIESIDSAPKILANEITDNNGAGILAINSAALAKGNLLSRKFTFGLRGRPVLEQDNIHTGNQQTPPKRSDLPQPLIKGNNIKNNGAGEIICQGTSPEIQENTIANHKGLVIVLFESDASIINNKIISGGPPAVRIDSGNPIIEKNTITGVLRFPFLGDSPNGSIKNNEIEIIQGPLFKKQNEEKKLAEEPQDS
jgi:hypothetical protein